MCTSLCQLTHQKMGQLQNKTLFPHKTVSQGVCPQAASIWGTWDVCYECRSLYPTSLRLSESSSGLWNLYFNKHPPSHPLESESCPESCVLPSTHPLFIHKKGHACLSCKTEYAFISYTVQSSRGRKVLCITLMTNILLYPFGMSLETWHVI